jgi:hypothetical protein
MEVLNRYRLGPGRDRKLTVCVYSGRPTALGREFAVDVSFGTIGSRDWLFARYLKYRCDFLSDRSQGPRAIFDPSTKLFLFAAPAG